MRKFSTLLLILTFFSYNSIANQAIYNTYQQEMDSAYRVYPSIPRGILEAVSFTQTHFSNLNANTTESCFGLPKYFGPMGLVSDGKGYFKNVADNVANWSGYNKQDILTDPQVNILAFASAYNFLMDSLSISAIENQDRILKILSEIPISHNTANDFALNSYVYSVFSFMQKTSNQTTYNFANPNIDLVQVFGQNNLDVLSSSQVQFLGNTISSTSGTNYTGSSLKSTEYGPALWVATPSCNYSSRNTTPISAVTIHTIQGTYSGAISWAQNCNANVSYHYVVRSSDGQITQMVLEADKAWHVGSENPYTIGIEHEGYVSDASWYTTAMYTASADLVRDITQSGYGISPLRTYYGPSTSGTNTLGGCTKIKGHQHYPNQSHTDPGINWNWPNYYKLINQTPSLTPNTASSGSYYDTGGASGNYTDDERTFFLIQPSGASTVTITFNSFDVELNWDYMFIYDGATTSSPLIGTYTGTINPGTLSSSGGSMLIEFRSDCATTSSGWEIVWNSNGSSTANDVIAPTTNLTTPQTWETTNFTTTFTDADNTGGSGVHHKFYQVIDYNGTEWRANDANGFFSDNFDNAIHPDWTISAGTWAINNGYLEQSDEAEGNSNIYASLNQSTYTKYLYHWAGNIAGSGTNKRAGFHFMCDDATLSNRGNSYFVWFRTDNNAIQIYKVVNDVFSLENDVTYTLNDAQWYDFKVVYDKTTGTIDVWVDNSFAASWTDSSPYTNGNAISFRSGNSLYNVNNLKVYHTRANTETINVGTNGDIRYQNPNSSTPSGRVKSIVIDTAKNVSSISFADVNVDWTTPSVPTQLNDGTAADIDNSTNTSQLSANWIASTDVNSDIARYWYAIGSTSGGTDVINWTDNWFNTSFTQTGLNLTVGSTYYVSVKAENGAGLISSIITSDGVTIDSPTNPPVAGFVVQNTSICSGDAIAFSNSSTDATSYSWSAPGAIPSTSTAVNPQFAYSSSGAYTITLTASGPGGSDVTSQTINVNVSQQPNAVMAPSNDTVYLPNGFVTFTNTSTDANGYFWNFGDGNTSTDQNPWNDYANQGTYIVELVAINGVCPNDTIIDTIYVMNNTGIEEIQGLSNIEIYPTPANQNATIQFTLKDNQTLSINVIDIAGRIAKNIVTKNNYSAGKNTIQLNVSDLANGMYQIVFSFKELQVAKPIMISK